MDIDDSGHLAPPIEFDPYVPADDGYCPTCRETPRVRREEVVAETRLRDRVVQTVEVYVIEAPLAGPDQEPCPTCGSHVQRDAAERRVVLSTYDREVEILDVACPF